MSEFIFIRHVVSLLDVNEVFGKHSNCIDHYDLVLPYL